MAIIRRIVIYAAIIVIGCVLGANVYNSVVDVPNWGSAIPQSIDAAKVYFAAANPGTFFRAVSPAAQITALLALIAAWPAGWKARALAAAALILAIGGDVFTFAYFYPRNTIMFGSQPQSVDALREAWAGWNPMNWLRSGIILLSLICELSVLSVVEAHRGARDERPAA